MLLKHSYEAFVRWGTIGLTLVTSWMTKALTHFFSSLNSNLGQGLSRKREAVVVGLENCQMVHLSNWVTTPRLQLMHPFLSRVILYWEVSILVICGQKVGS